ncbi:CLUMA_CG013395, isoform A [Clunio marinus]|uniref:CLUMA_CG013395, isoform A n=1 Tax=Clunio marinus TaxID=568069 RepID=A0A1J1IK31_9DIPT|nr:CLUMA_CG013395, isoform A [Clunio marinus]
MCMNNFRKLLDLSKNVSAFMNFHRFKAADLFYLLKVSNARYRNNNEEDIFEWLCDATEQKMKSFLFFCSWSHLGKFFLLCCSSALQSELRNCGCQNVNSKSRTITSGSQS